MNPSIEKWRFLPIFLLSMLSVVTFLDISLAELNPRMKLLARRAAHVDALRNLTENIYGLRLDSGTLVQNFVVGSDVVRTRLSAEIQGARQVDYIDHEDGMAEVTVEITLGSVETILGRRVEYFSDIIEATGYGAPPGMATSSTDGSSSSASSIRAVGYGLPPNEQGLTGPEMDLLGMRAAKNDALRNLAEKIGRVQVESSSTVQDYAVSSDKIQTRIRTMVNNARVISERKLHDGRYQVKLETDTEF